MGHNLDNLTISAYFKSFTFPLKSRQCLFSIVIDLMVKEKHELPKSKIYL